MTHRKLIEPMLKTMEPVSAYGLPGTKDVQQAKLQAAIKAAREYLAAPEQSEPTHYVDDHGLLYTAARVKFLGIAMDLMQPLYSHPQPTELTDAEIDEITAHCHDGRAYPMDAMMLPILLRRAEARAVLAAQKGKA